MEATRITITPSILRWAFKYSEITLDEQLALTEKISWLARSSKHYLNPTVKQLGAFAGRLHVPFAQLLLPTPPPAEDIRLAFRTQLNAPATVSLNLRDVIHEMQRKQAWYKEESGLANLPLPFIGIAAGQDERQTLAQLALLLTLTHHPSARTLYDSLRRQLANRGILNMQKGGAGLGTNRPLAVREVRAFVLLDRQAPLIFVNQKDSYTARIFSLVHEVVHLLRGTDELLQAGDHNLAEERLINHVVAAFLMPQRQFTEHFDRQDIAAVARYFNVSPEAAAIRAAQLGLVASEEEIALPAERVSVQKSGGDPYNNALSLNDRRFMTALVGAQREGTLQPTKAAGLIGISVKMLNRTVAKFNEREA